MFNKNSKQGNSTGILSGFNFISEKFTCSSSILFKQYTDVGQSWRLPSESKTK